MEGLHLQFSNAESISQYTVMPTSDENHLQEDSKNNTIEGRFSENVNDGIWEPYTTKVENCSQNGSDSSSKSKASGNTFSEEDFELDFADERDMLNFLSGEEKYDKVSFDDPINVSGMEMAPDNFDHVLNNTLSLIFDTENSIDKNHCTDVLIDSCNDKPNEFEIHSFNQSPLNGKEYNALDKSILDNYNQPAMKSFVHSSPIQFEENGSEFGITFDELTQVLSNEHVNDAMKEKTSLEATDINNGKDSSLGLQNIVNADITSVSPEANSLELRSNPNQLTETQKISELHKPDKTGSQVVPLFKDYIGNMEDIPTDTKESKGGKILEDSMSIGELSISAPLFPEDIKQYNYELSSFANISQILSSTNGFVLHTTSAEQANANSNKRNVSLNMPPYLNQKDIFPNMEIGNSIPRFVGNSKSDSVCLNGNISSNSNSDVVWTMQAPKPSLSPLQLNNNYIHVPEVIVEDDLVNMSKRTTLGCMKKEQFDNGKSVQQKCQDIKHIQEKSKLKITPPDMDNDSYGLWPENMTEIDSSCFNVQNDKNILHILGEGSSFSSKHAENVSYDDLITDIGSVLENNSLSSQFLLSNDDFGFHADNIKDPSSVTCPSHPTQSKYPQNFSAGYGLDMASHNLAKEPCHSGSNQKSSCNLDDLDTLLDSFMHEGGKKDIAPDIQLNGFFLKDGLSQKNDSSSNNNEQTDNILDDFLSGIDRGEVMSNDSHKTSNEMSLLKTDASTKNTSSADQVILGPKKLLKSTIFQVHAASQKPNRCNVKGRRLNRNVSFKTRPAGKPIKCVVRGQVVENVLQKRPRTLRFVLDKERRLENQDGTSLWPQREDFNPDKFSFSQGSDARANRAIVNNNFISQDPDILNQTKKFIDPHNTGSFVLPVGETGLSITIPTNAPTNITSFLPASSIGSIAKLTPILPSQKIESCNSKLACTTMAKHQVGSLLPNLSERGNGMMQAQNNMHMIIPNSVPLAKKKSLCQVPPVSSIEPIYVVVPALNTAQTKNTYSTPPAITTVVSCPLIPQSNFVGGKWPNHIGCKQQSSWMSHMHPIAPKINQTGNAPVKLASFLTTKVDDPVKIFVNTKSKSTLNVPTSVKNHIEELHQEETNMDEPRFKSEIVQSLQQNILKRKMHPEYVYKKSNRVLRDELRIRFPDIPENILSKLNIPPQAIHRGYFSLLDLQTLRTQALALRLRIIFREHVSNCIAQNCAVCLDFLRERQKLSSVEKERHLGSRIVKKGRNVGSVGKYKPSGRGRRGGRLRGSRIDRDDPTYEPPHSYAISKKRRIDAEREDIEFEMNQDTLLKMCTKKCNDIGTVLKRFQRVKVLCYNSKMRVCYSETNIHAITKSYDFIDFETHNNDDLYLSYYQNISSLKCLGNVQDTKVDYIAKDAKLKKLDISAKNIYSHEQKDRERQQSEMLKEAFYDLRVKKHIDRDFCIPFCEGDVKRSKGLSPKPLYYDVHSLNIGPLKVMAKYEREFLPKLRVIFTARKFTYEYELMCGMSKDHEPDPYKVRSVSGGPRPQLLITIDIPFKTIQAIAIHSNKVSLLVKTIPYIQVVARRGLSRVVVPEKNALSQAQRKYFARVKAVLSIFPLHQLLLADQGRAVSLRDGLCGFASWFKTFLVQQLPISEDHIPSWCLAPHLDPDSLVLKLSQHAMPMQASMEATRRSTCIIKDNVSGKYFGKVVENDKSHPIQLNVSKSSQSDCNHTDIRQAQLHVNKPQLIRLEPMNAIGRQVRFTNGSIHSKTQDLYVMALNSSTRPSGVIQKKEFANNASSQWPEVAIVPGQGNSPSCSRNVSLNEKGEEMEKQNTLVMLKKHADKHERNGDYSKDDSAALYLLSAVKSALASQRTTGKPSYTSSHPFPPPYHEKGCNCKGTCRQMECPCARGGVLCRIGQSCSCEDCDNPLNVLHMLNLDVHSARLDECLMQNLYSLDMTALCKVLVSKMVLPCCGNTIELRHIIPGTVLCSCCGTAVSYSWCTRYIHLQTLFPRNHCMACCCCKPTLHTHCQVCLHCTPSTGQGTCPKCGTPKPFGV